jgi:hypothetical protein
MDLRSTIFLAGLDGVLDNILQWHFEMWKKEHEYLGKIDKRDEWRIYSDLSRTIDSIFRHIEMRSLKDRASYSFFSKLERHADKYETESVSSRYYNEYLFGTFYQVYFQNIYDASDRYNIWNRNFPRKWKVTKSNLESSKYTISQITLNNFLEWASNRIWNTSEEKDYLLNDVSTNLFPEVDPILWALILIFIFSPYGDDRIRSVIERPWKFGFVGRFRVYSGNQEDEIRRMNDDEERNTFDLSYFLFGEQFSENNLKIYLRSLEMLSYPEQPVEERKRLRLQTLFTKMLHFQNKD